MNTMHMSSYFNNAIPKTPSRQGSIKLRADQQNPPYSSCLCRRFSVQPVGILHVQFEKRNAISIALSKPSIQISIALKQIP
jgi:hypothetical protein